MKQMVLQIIEKQLNYKNLESENMGSSFVPVKRGIINYPFAFGLNFKIESFDNKTLELGIFWDEKCVRKIASLNLIEDISNFYTVPSNDLGFTYEFLFRK